MILFDIKGKPKAILANSGNYDLKRVVDYTYLEIEIEDDNGKKLYDIDPLSDFDVKDNYISTKTATVCLKKIKEKKFNDVLLLYDRHESFDCCTCSEK